MGDGGRLFTVSPRAIHYRARRIWRDGALAEVVARMKEAAGPGGSRTLWAWRYGPALQRLRRVFATPKHRCWSWQDGFGRNCSPSRQYTRPATFNGSGQPALLAFQDATGRHPVPAPGAFAAPGHQGHIQLAQDGSLFSTGSIPLPMCPRNDLQVRGWHPLPLGGLDPRNEADRAPPDRGRQASLPRRAIARRPARGPKTNQDPRRTSHRYAALAMFSFTGTG